MKIRGKILKKSAPFLVVLMVFSIFPLNSAWASTSPAWSWTNINQVGLDEMQAFFGPGGAFSAESDLNWSSQMNPTELGKTLTYNYPRFYYALPSCSSQIKVGCIEAVEYRLKGESWEPAKLSDRQLKTRNGEMGTSGRNASGVISTREFNVWEADSNLHLPSGGVASFWKFPKAPHGGGNDYLVRVNVSGIRSAQPTWSDGKIQRYLEMNIFPFDGKTEFEFPKEIEIKVRLRLGVVSGDLWGWFDGRIDNPDLKLDSKSKLGIFEISGAPSRIPIGLTPTRKLSEIGNEVKSLFTCPSGLPQSMCPSVSGIKGFSTEGNAEISNFTLFENALGKSKTIAYRTEWWVKSTRWPDVANSESCPAVKDGFVGIVTTNASMYTPSAPLWNAVDSTFEFQVASPHLALDGSTNKGYYSLILPRKLAECRWGKDIDSARAVVSVVNAEGITNVTSVTHTLSKDLLTFKISGFTFSAPTIKVGLTSDKQTGPSASPLPTSEKSSTSSKKGVRAALTKKVTIICIKGKTIKKVTAQTPKCPAGYIQR
jgi:hypothetical protein